MTEFWPVRNYMKVKIQLEREQIWPLSWYYKFRKTVLAINTLEIQVIIIPWEKHYMAILL